MTDFLKKINRFAWLALVAVLPITSMPAVASLLGSDSVASPGDPFYAGHYGFMAAARNYQRQEVLYSYPAAADILPDRDHRHIPILFYDVPAFKGIDQFAPTLSALATLAIGFLFFVVASSYLIKMDELSLTVRVLNWSGLVMLVWCAIAGVLLVWPEPLPAVDVRFPGFAFRQGAVPPAHQWLRALEPSWLAHQLNMLYLPMWLACTVKKYTFHKFRIWKFSFENLLLIGGIGALVFSLSRVGFAAFFTMLAVAAVILHDRMVTVIEKKVRKKGGADKDRSNHKIISVLLVLAYLAVIAGTVFLFTKIDPRMENLFNFSFAQDNPLLRFFNELKFGDRVIYWLTGWNIFNHYPLMGVGLGNAGFYFSKYLPAYGWSLVEVEYLLNRTQQFY